jgi:branched-chain amino acid transport system permease protein
VLIPQILANGLLLGGLYACIAVGFSLVWGVTNIINMLHGSFIVVGAYAAFFSYQNFGILPFVMLPAIAAVMFVVGYILQRTVISRVIGATVLITLTLTFGLNLILDNALLASFKADYRKLNLAHPLGIVDLRDYADWLDVVVPMDRLVCTLVAVLIVTAVYLFLRFTNTGRAVVAVRMDGRAAALMGVEVDHIYAVTFGIGAAIAAATGTLLSVIFPISPLMSSSFLGKSFVICVLGGLGSIPGVLVGGFVLGLVESFGAAIFGSEHSLTISFALLLVLMVMRPTGLMGTKAFQ